MSRSAGFALKRPRRRGAASRRRPTVDGAGRNESGLGFPQFHRQLRNEGYLINGYASLSAQSPRQSRKVRLAGTPAKTDKRAYCSLTETGSDDHLLALRTCFSPHD